MSEKEFSHFQESKEIAKTDSFFELLEKAKEIPIDAVVVLSGGVKKIVSGETTKVIAGVDLVDDMPVEMPNESLPQVTRSSRMSSTAFSDPDLRQSLGWGKAKDIAAAEISKEVTSVQKEQPVIITSSRSTNNKTALTDAAISEAALRRLGVENKIVKQEHSLDTFTELLEAVKIAVENKWKHIVFATTAYQRPMAEAMMHSLLHLQDKAEAKKVEQILAFNAHRFSALADRASDQKDFKEAYEFLMQNNPNLEVSFVNAEDALMHRNNSLYGKLVTAARNNPVYDRQMKQDTAAAEQWRLGNYGKVAGQDMDELIKQWQSGKSF